MAGRSDPTQARLCIPGAQLIVQDIEAILHCVRYSSEAVPLGEEASLPIMFGDAILGRLAHRPLSGRGEERLRLTVVCLIREFSTYCRFHKDELKRDRGIRRVVQVPPDPLVTCPLISRSITIVQSRHLPISRRRIEGTVRHVPEEASTTYWCFLGTSWQDWRSRCRLSRMTVCARARLIRTSQMSKSRSFRPLRV
jgi:hypothetical protein